MTGDRRRGKRLRRHWRVAQFEVNMWTTIKITTAQTSNRDAGLQLCTMAKLAKTTIVPMKPDEEEAHK